MSSVVPCYFLFVSTNFFGLHQILTKDPCKMKSNTRGQLIFPYSIEIPNIRELDFAKYYKEISEINLIFLNKVVLLRK